MSAHIGFSPRADTGDRTVYLMALAAAAIALAFAVVTNQVWEDYYITFRISRNLVEGHGLVYQVGERVHTFTSPLGVLLPALGLWVTGSDAEALLFFRVLSVAALAGAAVLVAEHGRDHGWNRSGLWFVFILGILNAKTVAFAANGMETGLLLLLTALTWRELTRPAGPCWPALALGYGGLMWTRPDACVLAAAMTAGWWTFGAHSLERNARRGWWRKVGAALIAGGFLYAPWFFWTWHYYGSPIPQTIIAKAGVMPEGLSLARIVFAPLRCLVESTGLDGVFAPSYFDFYYGWPRDLMSLWRLLARVSAYLWLIPLLPRPARAASLAVLLCGVYLYQIVPYPWYYAPWTLLGSIALAGAAETAWRRGTGRVSAAGYITAIVLAVSSLGILVASTYATRVQQRAIEDEGRHQIGLWLHAHAAPSDTVFLEPLGYIGYFSQLKMFDFPGLSSLEVSRLVRAGQHDYAGLIAALRPVWVVIRPAEYFAQHLNENGGLRDYALVRHWNARPKLDAISFLPSRGWVEFDAEYLVFQRRILRLPPPAASS
jgi:hypothetical protein